MIVFDSLPGAQEGGLRLGDAAKRLHGLLPPAGMLPTHSLHKTGEHKGGIQQQAVVEVEQGLAVFFGFIQAKAAVEVALMAIGVLLNELVKEQ